LADDIVSTLTVEDQISPAMNAAAAAMESAAASADKLDKTVTRVGVSATALINRYDAATQMANKYDRAQRTLAQSTDTLNTAVAEGTISEDQRAAVLDKLRGNVQAAGVAMSATGQASDTLAAAHGKSAATAGNSMLAHAGFTRELVILGHEMLTGNYSRLAGSTVVLAQQSGKLTQIVSGIGSALIGLPGAALAVVGAMGYLAYEFESNERHLLSLQTALRSTRSDYEAIGAGAVAAGKLLSAIPGFGKADSTAAAATIGAVPNYAGSTEQTVALVRVSNDLAVVLGVTLPEAAKVLSRAMMEPGAEAERLAKEHFPGMTQAAADVIKRMADSGDKAGAFGKVLENLRDRIDGAAEASKTGLEMSLDRLGKAFHGAGAEGKSFASVLGETVTGAMTLAVNNLSALIGGITAVAGLPAALARSPLLTTQTPATTGGPVLMNSEGSGAMGIMQVKPDSKDVSRRYGFDLTTLEGNISAGMNDLVAKLTSAGGDVEKALAAYGGFTTKDPKAYIADVRGRNPAALPPGLEPLMDQLGAINALTPAQLLLSKQLALHESRGFQFEVNGVRTNDPAGGTPRYSATSLPLPVPPTPPQSAGADIDVNGMANSRQGVIDQGLAAADKAGTVSATGDAARANVKLYSEALEALAATGDTSSESVHKLQEALNKAGLAAYNAVGPVVALLRVLDAQTAGEESIAAAWTRGAAAAELATSQVKARQAALVAGVTGSGQYTAAVVALTAAYQRQNHEAQNTAANKQLFDGQQQVDYLHEEARTLGQSAEIRVRDLAVFKEQQVIAKTMPDLEQAQQVKLLANAAAIATATSELQRQQQAWNEIGNVATQISDQIGQAISTAFVSGSGSAVNFGNITKAVLSGVVNEIAKLAIINPILNSVFGGTRSTASDVLGVLGSAVGSGSSSGSSGSSASGFSSITDALGYAGLLEQLGITHIGSWLGLTGPNGVLSSLGGSSISGFLGTPIFGAEALAASTTESLAGLGASATEALATPASLGLAGTTIGGLIGGVGAGFTVGSLAGGLVQSSLGKVGPGPEIGAATGAVAGAVIGSVVPVIGTLIGGIIGGLIGGGGGGFIGPHAPSVYGGTLASIQNGGLVIGQTVQQGVNLGADAAAQTSAAGTLNSYLSATKVGLTSLGDFRAFGPELKDDRAPGKYAGIDALFPQLRFGTADQTLDKKIEGVAFASYADFQKVVTGYTVDQTNFATLINTMIPGLTAASTAIGSLNTAIAATSAPFDTATAAIDAMLAAGNISADQAAQISALEPGLVSARATAIAKINDAVNAQLTATENGIQGRYLTAHAAVTNNPAFAQQASLLAFDTAAPGQRTQFSDALLATYGQAYKTSAGYATEMATLERTLGEERLAIARAYSDKLAAAATTGVVSLASYAQKLEFGQISQLTPAAQLSLASSQFNAVAGASAAGDPNSISQFSGYADNLLNTSRAVNGSGAAFQTDYQRVLTALAAVANTTPDALTNAVLMAETRTQTQVLQAAIDNLTAQVVALGAQQLLTSYAPARIAA
jgi:hypothetical protein